MLERKHPYFHFDEDRFWEHAYAHSDEDNFASGSMVTRIPMRTASRACDCGFSDAKAALSKPQSAFPRHAKCLLIPQHAALARLCIGIYGSSAPTLWDTTSFAGGALTSVLIFLAAF
eukprot:365540-Chlamydomonas_euryale.AAC.2